MFFSYTEVPEFLLAGHFEPGWARTQRIDPNFTGFTFKIDVDIFPFQP